VLPINVLMFSISTFHLTITARGFLESVLYK